MPTQTKPPCILGVSRCDAVDWLDVCLPKKTGPMEWTCITKQQFLNVGHTSDVHARIWIWAWAFAHDGISKNPRLLASQMSEGVKGESGDWQRQGGKKTVSNQPRSWVAEDGTTWRRKHHFNYCSRHNWKNPGSWIGGRKASYFNSNLASPFVSGTLPQQGRNFI